MGFKVPFHLRSGDPSRDQQSSSNTRTRISDAPPPPSITLTEPLPPRRASSRLEPIAEAPRDATADVAEDPEENRLNSVEEIEAEDLRGHLRQRGDRGLVRMLFLGRSMVQQHCARVTCKRDGMIEPDEYSYLMLPGIDETAGKVS